MTNQHSLVSSDRFDRDLYTSSKTAERVLNAAIVRAEITDKRRCRLYHRSGNRGGRRSVSDRPERLTGEHHCLLVFQKSLRTIDQGCSGAGYLVE
jgi:hypothetical protein